MVEVYVLSSISAYLDIVPYRYCIPMSEHHRPITVTEEAFFSKCGTGKGKYELHSEGHTEPASVPVIAVFTKCDLLHGIAFGELRAKGKGIAEAVASAPDYAKEIFRANDYYGMLQAQKFPPRHFVSIEGEYMIYGDHIGQINMWLKEWTKSKQIALH